MIYLYQGIYLRRIKKGSVNSMYVEVNKYNETAIRIRKWSKGVPMQQERVIPNRVIMQQLKPRKRKNPILINGWAWN